MYKISVNHSTNPDSILIVWHLKVGWKCANLKTL